MKKRITIIATAVLIVALLVVGSTLAFFTDKGEVNNVITIGKVNITLTEPQFEKIYGPSHTVENITPGMYIEKDPTITNVGDNDAYIRCKISIGDLSNDQGKKLSAAQKQDLIQAIHFSPDWALSNGYYYYQKVLEKKSSSASQVKLFDSVTIPNTWNCEDNGEFCIVKKEFTINIAAEAIQKDNFNPTRDPQNKNIIAWQYSTSSDVPVSAASSTESRE